MNRGNAKEKLVAKIYAEMEETRMIVVDTVDQLILRGENIHNITDRTKALLEKSERFQQEIRGKRSGVRLERFGEAFSQSMQWTKKQSIALFFFVLYFLGKITTTGKVVLSALFPVHEGLTRERYNELDVYYEPFYDETIHFEKIV